MRNVSKPFSQIGRNLGLGSGEIYRFIAEPHLLSRWYLEDIDQFIDFVVECDLLLTALPDILDYVASQARINASRSETAPKPIEALRQIINSHKYSAPDKYLDYRNITVCKAEETKLEAMWLLDQEELSPADQLPFSLYERLYHTYPPGFRVVLRGKQVVGLWTHWPVKIGSIKDPIERLVVNSYNKQGHVDYETVYEELLRGGKIDPFGGVETYVDVLVMDRKLPGIMRACVLDSLMKDMEILLQLKFPLKRLATVLATDGGRNVFTKLAAKRGLQVYEESTGSGFRAIDLPEAMWNEIEESYLLT